jgi:hypothetical protein
MNSEKESSRSKVGVGLVCGIVGVLAGVLGFKLFQDACANETEEIEQKKKVPEINYDDTTDEYADYESFICPISNQIMKDPVMTHKGITYERRSILDWLKKKKECPITRTPLKEDQLTTNYALKNAIDEYLRKNKN